MSKEAEIKAKEYAENQYGWSEATETEKEIFSPDLEECKIHFKNGFNTSVSEYKSSLIERLEEDKKKAEKAMNEAWESNNEEEFNVMRGSWTTYKIILNHLKIKQ